MLLNGRFPLRSEHAHVADTLAHLTRLVKGRSLDFIMSICLSLKANKVPAWLVTIPSRSILVDDHDGKVL